MKATKLIMNTMTIIGLALIIWVMVSFVNVAMHNSPFDEDYKDYWSWNFFEVVFERSEK